MSETTQGQYKNNDRFMNDKHNLYFFVIYDTTANNHSSESESKYSISSNSTGSSSISLSSLSDS